MDDLGAYFFGAVVTAVTFVIVCFRLGLTVFDYFGIRHR